MFIDPLLSILVGLVLPTLSPLDDQAALEHFEKSVRPVLVEHCIRCHGPEEQRVGLRLDSGPAIAAGSEAGPVIEPGNPEESLLIEAVRPGGYLEMPPSGRLSATEIAALERWVQEGARWPGIAPGDPDTGTTSAESIDPIEAGEDFWAFQSISRPILPAVENEAWCQSPIDRFVLSKLEEAGLTPAARATKRDLIRRATFDLTGLPPTPAEVEEFVSDDSPEAFARLVDRLLMTPEYGERWARHWLDLARYADSNGMDENVAYAEAWRYRDYVIDAFNRDTPYNKFLTEQLAGDLMPAADDQERIRQLTATGFLVVGPKMLAEDDPVKMEMDIIDEQVDTVGKVFMGLTMGCARCHDHKFDPILAEDYYGMAGIFKSTKTMENFRVVAMWNERRAETTPEQAIRKAHEVRVAKANEVIDQLVKSSRDELRRELKTRLETYLRAGLESARTPRLRDRMGIKPGVEGNPNRIDFEAEAFDDGNVGIDRNNYGAGIGIILNVGSTPNIAQYNLRVPERGYYQVELRYAAAELRPLTIAIDDVVLIDHAAREVTGSWNPESQRWEASGIIELETAPFTLKLERDGVFPHIDRIALTKLELPEGVSLDDLRNANERAAAQDLNPKLVQRFVEAIESGNNDTDSLFFNWLEDDGESKLNAFLENFHNKTSESPIQAFLNDPNGPFRIPRKVEPLLDQDSANQLAEARDTLKAIESEAPPSRRVMATEDGTITDLPVHIRGSHLTLAENPTSRRFPVVIAGQHQPILSGEQSGRLALAEWLTSREHPLTSRVMANRLWHWHFGRGLVGSTDNFGKLGDQPTHPALLDWLATEFIARGWSIKEMHRTIMRSSTYQMSTEFDTAANETDPENKLLWRFRRRRLEAEAIRDAILLVTGMMGPERGGTLLDVETHKYVNNTSRSGTGGLSLQPRRSIYLPVIRSGVYPSLQAFDFADPSVSGGRRATTTVAPQALFMMNGELVRQASEAWADRLLDRTDLNDEERVILGFETAFARPPSSLELAETLEALQEFTDLAALESVAPEETDKRAWQILCQALIASSEFITLD